MAGLCLMMAACARGDAPASDQVTAMNGAAAAPVENGSQREPASTAARPPAQWVLTSDGIGPLRIGMTLAQIEAAAGPDSDPEAVGGAEPESCDQFRPARAPEGVIVMVEDGRLTRISLIDESSLVTDRGIGVGAPGSQVRETYASALHEEPHEYVAAPGAYLTHWVSRGADGANAPYIQDRAARGIRYELGENGRVSVIHGGGPSIQYVEGCA